MNGNNSNTPENTPENTEDKTKEEKPILSSPPIADKPVTEIKADVDLTKKPASVKETINLLDDDALDKDVTKNTEGDNKKKEEEEKKKNNINDFRQQTAQAPGTEKPFNPIRAQQQAKVWAKIIDIGIRFGLKTWSGQADNTGLDVPQSDKDVLEQQIALCLVEYKVVTSPIFDALVTLGAVYSTPFANAKESKKKIDEWRAKQRADELKNIKLKPELDPATGKHKKKKGGQYKA